MNTSILEHLVNPSTDPDELDCALGRDFHVYLRVQNRPDLLLNAINSVPEFHRHMTVMDNSPDQVTDRLPPGIDVFRPPVPLTFTQSHNWFFQDARNRDCNFMVWMHSDASSVNNGHLRLVDFVRKHCVGKRKWGLAWTFYDSLAAVNLEMIDDVGGYDTVFPKYLCDNDHTYRMRVRGWETIDTGIHTEHIGSSTIKSDARLRFTNDIVHQIDSHYYRAKWGGDPDKEQFQVPFNRPDVFGDSLKPVGVW